MTNLIITQLEMDAIDTGDVHYSVTYMETRSAGFLMFGISVDGEEMQTAAFEVLKRGGFKCDDGTMFGTLRASLGHSFTGDPTDADEDEDFDIAVELAQRVYSRVHSVPPLAYIDGICTEDPTRLAAQDDARGERDR